MKEEQTVVAEEEGEAVCVRDENDGVGCDLLVMLWCGMVWCGWCGVVWLLRCGWCGVVWCGCCGVVWLLWFGVVQCVMVGVVLYSVDTFMWCSMGWLVWLLCGFVNIVWLLLCVRECFERLN